MRINYFLFLAISALFLPSYVFTQDKQTETDTEIKARDLVSFLEFSLNTIGSAGTAPREKDIIITQSYLKFFRDEEVQIEDDLDQSRSTVTNKDVQAYLKDVDFFFRNVQFKFDIEEIQQLVNDNSEQVYLVKINRNLSGILITGDTINETITRYLEINYNEEQDDLKIVSFYTTKLSEDEDLHNWWSELSFEWRYIFQQRFNMYDSVNLDQLKELVSLDSLDLSNNQYIVDFEPLFKLDRLKYLDLSNTNIESLSPLRVHNKLEYLDLSGTRINGLEHLKYASEIQVLKLEKSSITNFSGLESFQKLRLLNLSNLDITVLDRKSIPESITDLNLSGTFSGTYDWLNKLIRLKKLDLSFSNIKSLQPISQMPELEELLIEGTEIKSVEYIANCDKLIVLNIESTHIENLDDLKSLSHLKKVYCDKSGITKKYADSFMQLKPQVLIVFESAELKIWWSELDASWKKYFTNTTGISSEPGRDELARITQLDSIDISNNKEILSFKGIGFLRNLNKVSFHNTFIADITELQSLSNLRYINGNTSNLTSIDVIYMLPQLNFLDIANTRVESIAGLSQNRNITYLNIDNTQVSKEEIFTVIQNNPNCLVIYKTKWLFSWWNGLSPVWKEILLKNIDLKESDIDSIELHKISYLKKIQIDSVEIFNLDPLKELDFLEELYINRTPITQVKGLSTHAHLTHLSVTKSPLSDISSILEFTSLNHLDLSNTAIQDLKDLTTLKDLEVLKLSGTKIKNLKELSGLDKLKQLDISNTFVNSFKPIKNSDNVDLIICYNSKIKQKGIDDFLKSHPDCKIMYY